MERKPHTPEQAIQYLKARYSKHLNKSYLAKLRSTGQGPVFFRIGASVFYDEIDLDNWIRRKQTPKGRSATHIAAIQAGSSAKLKESRSHFPDYDDGWVELD